MNRRMGAARAPVSFLRDIDAHARLLHALPLFVIAEPVVHERLNARHPDRTGGLGFLNASPFAFVPILVAETSLVSALIAERIWHQGATLPQFRLEILAVVIFLMLLVLLPQMFCAFQLERAWRTGAAEYGVLGSHYVDSFRRKWLCAHPHTRE